MWASEYNLNLVPFSTAALRICILPHTGKICSKLGLPLISYRRSFTVCAPIAARKELQKFIFQSFAITWLSPQTILVLLGDSKGFWGLIVFSPRHQSEGRGQSSSFVKTSRDRCGSPIPSCCYHFHVSPCKLIDQATQASPASGCPDSRRLAELRPDLAEVRLHGAEQRLDLADVQLHSAELQPALAELRPALAGLRLVAAEVRLAALRPASVLA